MHHGFWKIHKQLNIEMAAVKAVPSSTLSQFSKQTFPSSSSIRRLSTADQGGESGAASNQDAVQHQEECPRNHQSLRCEKPQDLVKKLLGFIWTWMYNNSMFCTVYAVFGIQQQQQVK